MTNAIAIFVALPVTILVATFIVMAAKSQRRDVVDFEAPNLGENKFLWGVTLALSLVYLMAGVPKIGEIGPIMNKFTAYGYSTDFLWLVGALELAGAVLLLFRRTAWLSASGLSILAGGSVYTHLAAGEFVAAIIPLACFSGLVYIAFRRFPVEAFENNDDANAVAA